LSCYAATNVLTTVLVILLIYYQNRTRSTT